MTHRVELREGETLDDVENDVPSPVFRREWIEKLVDVMPCKHASKHRHWITATDSGYTVEGTVCRKCGAMMVTASSPTKKGTVL